MTHVRIHHLTLGILAIAAAIAIALSATATPASARTFNFSSSGSLVLQPLPAQWACELSRALGDRTSACRDSRVR